MRFFSILTALLVCAGIYLFVFERDLLMSFGTSDAPQEVVEEQTPEVPQAKAVTVVARTLTAENVESGLVLRGQTEASRKVDVKAETNGLVISQPLRKGTFVEQGQLLCQLDSGTRQAQLAEAKARLAEAEANNNVSASLVKRGFASETQAIGRVAALESAQAAVQAVEAEIEKLELRAPFAGLLESDTAELGALMQMGAPCATVTALDPIKLVGFVPEDRIAKLTIGSMAGARLVTGQEVVGKVTFLSRSADPLTRTFRVEVTVPNADMQIRDGSTANIFVSFEGVKGHLLPQSSLTLDDNGRLGVRIVEDSAAKFMPITIIRDTTEGVWVAGLPETVDVITVGHEYITNDSAIEVTYEGTAS